MASRLTTTLSALALFLLLAGESQAQFDRPWKVFAVPYSHTDVGYTATVPQVVAAHERYLDSVVAYVNRTAANAEGTRFKWTIEIPWVLESYIRDRSPSQVEQLMALVRSGSVDIGAIHFGLQTDLCGNEELVRSLSYAQDLRRDYDVPIRTALINDTPGFTWSLAQVLPKSGVPYLSVAMNSFAADFYKTTTVPFLFWLQAQSGDRVLVWRCIDSLIAYIEGGWTLGIYGTYANFNTRLTALLTKLAQRGYPYDEVFINCATGDNAAPSMAIVNNVQQWNNAHADAKVVIATASEFFDTVAAKYAGQIPVLSGDAPNWWAWMFSPGASGVFARSRRAQILLPAAEMLAGAAYLWDPAFVYPDEALDQAYVNNLLVEDHNLGDAFNRAAENAEFWTRKVGWANAAHDTGANAISAAVRSLAGQVRTTATPAVAVFNPTSWTRDGVVTLSLLDPVIASLITSLGTFDILDSRTGTPLPIQTLSDTSVAFLAKEVPATGYRSFPLVKRVGPLPQRVGLIGLTLENDLYRVDLDQTRGGVRSVMDKELGQELVSGDGVFNQYLFNRTGTPGSLTIAASDSGPVLQRITLSGSAPGTSAFQVTVTLPAGEKRIDFLTDFNRLAPTISSGEDIDFDFHFASSMPALQYEIPFGNIPIFTSELSGFRSNHYAPGRWMYVSLDGAQKGAILATAESPIIAANTGTFNGSLRLLTQYNGPSTAYRAGLGPQQMFFSVTSGATGLQPDQAARFSYGALTPLPSVILPAGQGGMLPDSAYSLLTVTPPRLQQSTIKKATDGSGIIVRLFNPTGEQVDAQLTFGGKLLGAMETSMQEVDERSLGGGWNSLSVSFGPYEIKTIRVMLSPTLDVTPDAAMPVRFTLYQNYPNPFNSKTVVSSQYSVASWVKLALYDLLGREVAVLVNERRAPGMYRDQIHADMLTARGLATGVYIYRMTAGAHTQSRTMLLLK